MYMTIVRSKHVPQVMLKHNEKSWPKTYKCNFLEAGAVSYEDVNQGVALLKKETMDGWMQSFVGKPVIIDHQDVTPKNFKQEAVGYITNVYFNSLDGWYWADFLITDDEGHETINNGWSVSCSFDVLETTGGGEWHAIKYDEEITKGQGLHLALVKTPRYEDCRIVKDNAMVTMYNSKSSVKDNATDFSIMSPLQVDKYMQSLSDVGLQTILDSEHPEEIKKIAKAHMGDREKKKEEEMVAASKGVGEKKNQTTKEWADKQFEELVKTVKAYVSDGVDKAKAVNLVLAGSTLGAGYKAQLRKEFGLSMFDEKVNMVELTKEGGVKMWKLFAKKGEKIENDKIDATKVFVDVDGEMVPLSTLMNSVGPEFEVLQESDSVKINGKDVSIKDLVAAHKANKKNDDEDPEKKEDDKKKADDAKANGVCACGKKLEEDDKKRDDGLCVNCFPKKKAEDDKKKADDEKKNAEEKEKKEDGKDKEEDPEKKNAKKEFFMDLNNARNIPIETGSSRGGADTREDKAARGKKYFGSHKKSA